jgi:dimethylargininase
MAQLNLVFKFKTLLNRRFFHSFQYTRALTRSIDASLAQNALRTNPDFIVNYELAIQQHKKLVTTMADLGLQITNLPSDGFADSVFIEDTAIVVDNIALITNPGANSRKKETLRVKEILEFQFKDFHVEIQKEGQMDGGDVLFTG